MFMTYEAILEGDKLKWKGSVPQQVSAKGQIAVYVTLLEEVPEVLEKQEQGQKMAEALSKLAALNERSIADPLLWQKELRQDRPLPRE